MLEAENEENGPMQHYYIDLYEEFKDLMQQKNPQVFQSIQEQIKFRDRLFELATTIKDPKQKTNFDQKRAKLKELISKSGKFDMSNFDAPKPMPIDPKIFVRGVNPDECFVFKSAMCPLKMTFHTLNQEDFSMIRKKDQSAKQL